nr:AAA family ATPase [uncultured Flavobacterium sp.]
MQNYIQVKNFRKYIISSKINLNNYNFFVGTNSSGKSTAVKALLLMMAYIKSENITEIDFSSQLFKNLNIQNFERLKCKYSDQENPVEIELQQDGYKFILKLIEHNLKSHAKVLYFGLEDLNNDVIYEYESNLNIEYTVGKTTTIANNACKIRLINNHLYKNEIIEILNSKIGTTNNLDKEIKINKQISLIENENIFDDVIKYINPIDYRITGSLQNMLMSIHADDRFRINAKDESDNVKDIIYKYRFSYDLFEDQIDIFSKTAEPVKAGMNLKSKSFKIFSKILKNNIVFLPLTYKKYTNLNSILDKTNDLAQITHEYYIANNANIIHADNFIKKWMSKENFNIGDDFEIEFHGGEAYEINIIENGHKIPLIDKGSGNIQIFKILLIIATQIKNNNKNTTLILEEPELNLHPKIQSKLADLLTSIDHYCDEVLNKSLELKVIIETHSEYLIRRLQVLVIQNKVINNKIKISYFPSELDQNPFTINIKKDGSLDENFGPGFFDEASNHMLEIIKFNTLNKN